MISELNERRIENSAIETGESKDFDDDGRVKRTGTLMTASAHIITAVIGSGVLSLAWAIAQLGWIGGVLALLIFSLITLFASRLLANIYRYPEPNVGTRNYTYMQAVQNYLGGIKYKFCGVALYVNLFGTSIGYTITTALAIGAIEKAICFHEHGKEAKCETSSSEISMMVFGIIQILLSQIPDFGELSALSVIAAIMSFTYSFIGIGLSVSRIAGGVHPKTSLSGVPIGADLTIQHKVWRCFQALGNIAFAYSYSLVFIDIQDTLKSSPPENKVMMKASAIGVAVTTLFYMLCGILGYVAFGNNTPGNLLTGFYEGPLWLVNLANACIAVHLVGAYQVYAQPLYRKVEDLSKKWWPESDFVVKDYPIWVPFLGTYNLNLFRSVWRTFFVAVTTTLSITFPFFNDVVGLIGALVFWPLTVYFPIEMHITQKKIRKSSGKWFGLKLVSGVCLIVSILAATGSITGIAKELKTYKPFMSI